MNKIKLTKDFIRLGQLLKMLNIIDSGGQAKDFLLEHEVIINERIAGGRGAKIVSGDKVFILDKEYTIE